MIRLNLHVVVLTRPGISQDTHLSEGTSAGNKRNSAMSAMNKLSATQVQSAKPKSSIYRLYDGCGLTLSIRPNGGKSWQLRYRRPGGKEATASLGSFPDIGLSRRGALAPRPRLTPLSP
jgi:hypothetical protein